MLMETFLSYNLILPKYLRSVKEKGSLNPKMRAWERWGKGNYKNKSPAKKSGEARKAKGQKGRGSGGRNFCPFAN